LMKMVVDTRTWCFAVQSLHGMLYSKLINRGHAPVIESSTGVGGITDTLSRRMDVFFRWVSRISCTLVARASWSLSVASWSTLVARASWSLACLILPCAASFFLQLLLTFLDLGSVPYASSGKTSVYLNTTSRNCMSSAFEDSSMLRTEGVRVGVNPGGTNEAFVRKSMEGGRGQIIFLEQGSQARALMGDAVDVVVTDAIEARLMLQRHPGKLCTPSRSVPDPSICT
jgi:hypothetical protein